MPIRVRQDVVRLREDLEEQRAFYEAQTAFANDAQRGRFTSLFDTALRKVDEMLNTAGSGRSEADHH
jgi:hypothetical protein